MIGDHAQVGLVATREDHEELLPAVSPDRVIRANPRG
jgi:hypothetical protein